MFRLLLRAPVDGVHAIALTPGGKVVLVRLTYAAGWRLPGGGRKRNETAVEAMLRELREEIGMTSHGSVRHLPAFDSPTDSRSDESSLFIVENVEYRPRQTLEIEEVGEFDPGSLPPDVNPSTGRTVGRAL